MKGALAWIAGIGASVGVHGGLAAVLAFATEPQPLEAEPAQTSRIKMEAYEVSETKAKATDPSGETTKADDAEGNIATQNSIRSQRAEAQEINNDPTQAIDPDTPAQAALAPDADRPEQQPLATEQSLPVTPEQQIVAPSIDDTVIVAAQNPSGAKTPALFAQGAVVQASNSTGQAAQAVLAPQQIALAVINAPIAQTSLVSEAAITVVSGTPPAEMAQAAKAQGISLSAANADANSLAPRAPNAGLVAASPLITEQRDQISVEGPIATPQAPEAIAVANQNATDQAANLASERQPSLEITAQTGWAGSAGALFDPVSLAAVQSFMQPLDAAQNALSARDSIATLLSRMPCSRLSATFIPETGILELRGHVPDIAMREPILNAIRTQLGESIPVGGSMLVLPSPQCDVLSRLEELGLPQSDGQKLDPMRVGATTQINTFDYGEGERVIIRMRSPDYPAYVYVDFFDVDGRVLHLRPNQWENVLLHDPDTPLEIGADRPGETSVELIVRPPFGQELAIAYATSHPLYEGLRETIEPSGPYLEYMRERIAKLRETIPDYKGEWVYMFVQTHEAN